jgi:hypothetical protein
MRQTLVMFTMKIMLERQQVKACVQFSNLILSWKLIFSLEKKLILALAFLYYCYVVITHHMLLLEKMA